MIKKILVGAVAVSAVAVPFLSMAAWDVSGYSGPSSTDTLAMANGSIGVVWDNVEAVLPTLITFAVVMTLIFGAIYFVLRRLHILR